MSNKPFDFEAAKKQYLELGDNKTFQKMILDGKARQVLEPFLRNWWENKPEQIEKTTVQNLHSEQDTILAQIDQVWKPIYKEAAHLKPKLPYMDIATRIEAIKQIKEAYKKCVEQWQKKGFYKKYGKLPNYEAQELPDDLYTLKQRLLTLRTYIVPSRKIAEEKKQGYEQEKINIEAKIKLLESND